MGAEMGRLISVGENDWKFRCVQLQPSEKHWHMFQREDPRPALQYYGITEAIRFYVVTDQLVRLEVYSKRRLRSL